jgi:hypothetical protein|tara:strand:- start:105 stop:947 length:843 start_codon:yes stop_codon:yes gene_type:complete
MSFITLANTIKIILNMTDVKVIDLQGSVYKIPIYFFSRFEKNALLAVQELLKDPKNFFTEIYQPYKAVDSFTYIYEGQIPSYHEHSCCPRLNSDFQNFEIPTDIKEQGVEKVKEFRKWFKTVEHLIEKPYIFVARLHARWGINTNPRAINLYNSGSVKFNNIKIEVLEKRIDSKIKAAGQFYYKNEKNKAILKRFSKLTFLAKKEEDIYYNDTDYSDQEIKDLLREYDKKFKRPLKADLIEYYRVKLNPEIKMEGLLLERLGFKACGQCHRTDYEKNDVI